jgi:MoxR-like ATPase
MLWRARSICRFIEFNLPAICCPSDVIGLSIYNQRSEHFEWNAGPIFSNIVLADEINRATPKTQSALLEAMAEEQITVEGVSRPLPLPFMVIATQNPTEHHGTYPLPESQLDRFMLRLHVGYPNIAGRARNSARPRARKSAEIRSSGDVARGYFGIAAASFGSARGRSFD